MLRIVRLFTVFIALLYCVSSVASVKIVATVDDELISSLDVEKRVKFDKLLHRIDETVADSMSLKFLIDEALLRSEAKNLKISVNESDIKEATHRILKFIDANGSMSLLDYIQKNDLDYTTVLRYIESKVIWDKILLVKVIPYINVSDDEVDNYIAENKSDKFETMVSLNQVFIPSKSKDIVKIVLKALLSNVSIHDIRDRYKNYGISIDEISGINVDSLDHKIKANLINANIGQVMNPIEFEQGYLIMQLLDKVQISKKFIYSEVMLKQVMFSSKDKNKLDQMMKLQNSKVDCSTFNKIVSQLKLGNVLNFVVKVKDLSTKMQSLLQNAKVNDVLHFASDNKENIIVLCEVREKNLQDEQFLDKNQIDNIKQSISIKKIDIKSMQLMSQLHRSHLVERY
ncbi:SurA N-terminal domain-containing protein [Neoehrlichia mikurensis]|uniref:SurA N-terminal domain-containing protein n=1 Tax=Neoehrlichia mikurensis TaxID=89586 RepID=A0A9Q9BTQ4_9RICK|nr:SurA N-terminal domain-containing protein [Neoehrlichia mikurensis]QXK92202.1 SurA N-terminal domain-containing protein [Neoehrlichia mikurensis]QXK92658.1 SurA N-terminal domain-containing protein [Neoehrlichia mikurensis]QXK93895.1 SurA N-terminal domain-containing protein [Neoehrlichia mikurensis]UTO55106.1 SurA N-terminal domain-containing protein [Neoehrlichia mikurensis]UTO56025.1 SurA N-terminal domain-containing protein [Neoehrlichia mikurensis]